MTVPKRILIVENDEDTLFLIANALKKEGYLVETCVAGSGIIESKHILPDLFILDKELPTVDGIAVSKFLRLHKPTKAIPIIMISGHQLKNTAKQAGIDAFILKPFELSYLIQIVRKYMEQGHTQLT
jgi:CheY-like chemotaxis protein